MLNVRYSVYRNPGDIPVAIYKNRLQCAAAMGITVKTFDAYASKMRSGKRKYKKWEIIRHEEGEDNEE